ncbi:YIP1 family protein [Haloarcula sp. Atlit-120R]|uniref:YIP1 family protein n=1 Tax=Haloarcula sp. Atlit-120R TaxID=2282135 RepID=UPI000EF289BB|nr:hypothetical protein DVK01_11915 [Haloarcula sp. Atlit-120R]
MVSELIYDPDEFFNSQASSVSFRGPILIILMAAVTNLITPLIIIYRIATAAPQEVRSFVMFIGFLGGISGLFSIFIMWSLTSIFFHTAASYLNYSGSLRETALLSGWGFFPQVLTGAYSAGMTHYVTGQIFTPENVNQEQLQLLITSVVRNPASSWISFISILGVLWSFFLWTLAVKNYYGMSLKRSAIISGIPSLVIILLNSYTLINHIL